MARCHRIGQTKPVTVYRLVTQDSVEEQALTRLTKKLYLSIKVTSTIGSPDSEAPSFSKGELVKLLRMGATALATPIGAEWKDKPIEEILKESHERQKKREDLVMSDDDLETMEADLLRDQERIKTNIFEGRVLSRTYKEITDGTPLPIPLSTTNQKIEWRDLTKRSRTERTVIIDGHAVNRESLSCSEWEAFPTFSSNHVIPPKKQKRTFDHQNWCQWCRDGGEVLMCSGCPRVFHVNCAGYIPKRGVSNFYCPQHSCCVCHRNTTGCGGMLFRCQTCPDSYWYPPSFVPWGVFGVLWMMLILVRIVCRRRGIFKGLGGL
jgi:SWI/SNF-related matrix-associated actin-dependent regulator of chromatin subfamily A member 5